MSRTGWTCPCEHQTSLSWTGTPAHVGPAWEGIPSPQAPLPRTVAESQWPPGSAYNQKLVGGCFTSVSLIGLGSSKATHLLSLTGLGDGAHLFTWSPVQSTAEGTCSSWPAGRCLLQLLVHPLLPKHQQLLNQCWLLDCPWETEQPSLSV